MLGHTVGSDEYLGLKGQGLRGTIQKDEKYISSHEHWNMKQQEGRKIEEFLLLILHKVEKHDKVLEEIREKLLMLN